MQIRTDLHGYGQPTDTPFKKPPPLFPAKREKFFYVLVRKVHDVRRPPLIFQKKSSKGGVFLAIGCDLSKQRFFFSRRLGRLTKIVLIFSLGGGT